LAIIKPFRAVRATRDKVALVSSRSFDAYSEEELEAHLRFNPFSFLHIISPNYSKESNLNSNLTRTERFNAIKEKYQMFKSKHTYIKEKQPVYYIYKKVTSEYSFCGIIAASSTDDYKNGIIKKHEKTIKKRELLFENYLKNTGFNAEPVLLTYPDNDILKSVLEKYQNTRAEYEFTTGNNKSHLLWIVENEEDMLLIEKEFSKMDALYISDGHHRSASSSLLATTLKNENKNHTGNEAYNFCLSYLIPESDLKISEFNRLIKDLNGYTKNEFLQKLEKHFIVKKLNESVFKPVKKHTFSVYLDHELYLIELKSDNYTFKTPLHYLDTHILYKTILKKILGVKNLRNCKKIAYASSRKGHDYLKNQVDNGKFKVAFGLYPISINQLKSIADANLTMPPKSTYILPKLRSGLTIYEF
jgi:uncharacterized protein (DUF1015 family)